jgi:hypothetical protein
MGLREQTKIEFRLIKLFLGLLIYGMDLLLEGKAFHIHWVRDREKFYKELEKYEKDYIK